MRFRRSGSRLLFCGAIAGCEAVPPASPVDVPTASSMDSFQPDAPDVAADATDATDVTDAADVTDVTDVIDVTDVVVDQPAPPDAGAALRPSGDMTLPPGTYRFESIEIPEGVTLRIAPGAGVLQLLASGTVRIDGVIDVSGGVGGYGPTGVCSGGNTGAPGVSSVATGAGPGGGGGGGPWGHQRDRLVPWPGPGLPGAGPAGGAGGRSGGVFWFDRYMSGYFSPDGTAEHLLDGAGGGTGLGVYSGATAPIPMADPGCEPTEFNLYCTSQLSQAGHGGGGSIGSAAAGDLALTREFAPGSGGGGGGGTMVCGGGGGGGGGALRVVSMVGLSVGARGGLLARGGGGDGGGGGGSGGVIDVAAPTIDVADGAVIDVAGGESRGGAGGLGRIRVRVTTDRCTLGGTWTPPLVRGCEPTPTPMTGRVYVAPWSP